MSLEIALYLWRSSSEPSLRAVFLSWVSSAYLCPSCWSFPQTWQSVQFKLKEAAKNPIVPMNSFTGIPLQHLDVFENIFRHQRFLACCRLAVLTACQRNSHQAHDHRGHGIVDRSPRSELHVASPSSLCVKKYKRLMRRSRYARLRSFVRPGIIFMHSRVAFRAGRQYTPR